MLFFFGTKVSLQLGSHYMSCWKKVVCIVFCQEALFAHFGYCIHRPCIDNPPEGGTTCACLQTARFGGIIDHVDDIQVSESSKQDTTGVICITCVLCGHRFHQCFDLE